MDVHTPDTRAYNMSQIKGKNTKPELIVRKWIWAQGYRYRVHKKTLPGKPDIVFSGMKKVILVNGCFWHKHDCRYFQWPATRQEFWRKKIEGTVERDARNMKSLKELGWDVLVVWECETRGEDLGKLEEKLTQFLKHST